MISVFVQFGLQRKEVQARSTYLFDKRCVLYWPWSSFRQLQWPILRCPGDASGGFGYGSGKVVIAPTAEDHGTFAVQITVNVHGTSPNRTYVINRAPDLNPDGVCTGAFMFTSTLVTSAGGAGAAHFDLHRGAPFVSGTKFDVKWQLLGDDGSQLVSDCVTVTVK